MTIAEILTAQLSDLFRIGLLIALVVMANNTAAQTGRLVPILLGLVFVAVLIPTTMGNPEAERLTPIAGGLLSNALIVALVVAVWEGFSRLRGKS